MENNRKLIKVIRTYMCYVIASSKTCVIITLISFVVHSFFFFFTKIMSSAMARKEDKAKVSQKRSSRNCIRKLRN